MSSRNSPTAPGMGSWLRRGSGLRGTIVCDHHGPTGAFRAEFGLRRAAARFDGQRSMGRGEPVLRSSDRRRGSQLARTGEVGRVEVLS